MPWLNSLKIALAERNIENINTLIEELPKFETLEEMNEAQYLFKEVAVLLHSLKSETQNSMQQIKKNLTFLRSTEMKAEPTLDIKS